MGAEAYMYYGAECGEWFVSTGKEVMEAGRATGEVSVVSADMTPDAATRQWQLCDDRDKWHPAPKIATRICTEHERQAMVRQAEEEAVAKSKEARIIVIAGQEAGEVQHRMMGVYVLMEGKIVNGRGVWKREGMGAEAYMYYGASYGAWFVSTDKEVMEAGRACGDLSVGSDDMTPDAATKEWELVDDGGEEWHPAPKITTRICTEHERQAMVRQAEEEAAVKA
jgi:hypothetical protein